MIELTDEQAVAAGSNSRLVNIVSAPGSGKTTVASERFGYLRYTGDDHRGVLGLSFTRAASAELRRRIEARWGSKSFSFPHRVGTFDALFVDILHVLLTEGLIDWPNGHRSLHVVDDYKGYPGFRWLGPGNYRRVARLRSNSVRSQGTAVDAPRFGIGAIDQHVAVLKSGVASHEDVRAVLMDCVRASALQDRIAQVIAQNFRSVIIDEVYDAAPLDLILAHLAADAGLSVTLIGDPRQALYGWRGASPDKVATLLKAAPEPYIDLSLSRSFRFEGAQMPLLSEQLREGRPVSLPLIRSDDVDVALARQWSRLWPAGDNVLPLAFRNVSNATDAVMNLLLDVVTRARLGARSFGREPSLIQLGLDREMPAPHQDEVLKPILQSLQRGDNVAGVMQDLRAAVVTLGGSRRPNRLGASSEVIRLNELKMLAKRLNSARVIPGLTVHQAKGREWSRVGLALSLGERELLSSGLRELEEEDCILYVAVTRAKRQCGLLTNDLILDGIDAAVE